MKTPEIIERKFGSVIEILNESQWPFTSAYLLESKLALLKIVNLPRDSYKEKWYEFIGCLHFSVIENDILYLVVDRFTELHYNSSDLSLFFMYYFLPLQDLDAELILCENSCLPAIIKLKNFIRKFPEFNTKKLDLSRNLMVMQDGELIFCDPLV